MTRTCSDCAKPISVQRLAALPDTDVCAECSTEQPVRGRLVWDHKTAPTLEVMSADRFNATKQYDRRHVGACLPLQSFSADYDQHFGGRSTDLVSGESTPDGARLLASAQAPDELTLSAAPTGSFAPAPVAGVDYTPMNLAPSRCHPNEPRVNPRGDCMDCALRKQRMRIK